MVLSRRHVLSIIGGGAILAAGGAGGYAVTRKPQTALAPWSTAGLHDDPRRNALSFALLAPNPHNRQPWMVELSRRDEVVLHADTSRLLPETDPFNRQITIGLGCFLEVMRMAAAQQGYRVDTELFPEGESGTALDSRPVARAVFRADSATAPDPLFAHVLDRRSLKEPFDLGRRVNPDVIMKLATAATPVLHFGGSVDDADIARYRALTHEALRIEIDTPRTFMESVNLFRIGHAEVDASPDGIDFSGPLFEALRLTGLFTRAAAAHTSSSAFKAGADAVFANADTAMGHVWLVSNANTRRDQIAAGVDWVRVNLAATAQGLGIHPLSQALQEYPEMVELYRSLHGSLAPRGGTIQIFARIGYGPVTPPSPRWPLEQKIAQS